MKYMEYLNAARKHVYTSEILYDSLSMHLQQQSPNNGITKRLTLNLYYISGYVIECTLKYGIYALIGHDKDVDITKINSKGITYNEKIKHHKFSVYDEFFNREYPGIILIDRKDNITPEVKKLYNGWDAEIRYVYNPIPEKFKHSDEYIHVMKFNEHAKNIFKLVESNIR
ncbi:hypothetical protein ACQ91M_000205 [Yersinia enterocolitica]|nr:hypothetical protein [Yersinia enterocolitica]HDL7624249.1 hypothetical protein [Yersinia enterocolitica]HDL7699924.1 hypothetical protein [Yersinia enterocolitica]